MITDSTSASTAFIWIKYIDDTLKLYVFDSDSIAITLWDKNGRLWFTGNRDGVKIVEQTLSGGNLNFHSTTYQWLVVSGARAQYKGIGTINGAGTYCFLLTAIDGQITGGLGTDKFRIKIWERIILTESFNSTLICGFFFYSSMDSFFSHGGNNARRLPCFPIVAPDIY